jgi:D-alanine transfer protein
MMKRTPHLTAGTTSILVLLLALIGFNTYAVGLESKYVNALVPLNLEQTLAGTAVQRAALRSSDILPVFGSSELILLPTPYQADKFFAKYPTGFTVMDVAGLGVLSITMAQDLAALGPDLRGRKIVLSIMPGSFFLSKRGLINNNPTHDFAMNFSRLHAYEAVFSPYLSYGVKNQIAQRMLDFPDTVKSDPFLVFCLQTTAGTSGLKRALYYLLWPLGELQIQILNLQDHAEVVYYIWSNRLDPNVTKVPQTIDWDRELGNALAEQKLNTNNNPYAVENSLWWYFDRIDLPHPPGSEDSAYTKNLLNSQEWSDFKVLLMVLQQLGARPLIVSRPLNVPLWEALGVSEPTQKIFYAKLHSVVDPFHMPLLDLRQYEHDRYFSIDQGSHTSREGWVYIDKILDDYYHGRIP